MKKSVLTIAIATGVFALAFSGQAIVKAKDLKGAQFNAVAEQGRKLNFQIKDVELDPEGPQQPSHFRCPPGWQRRLAQRHPVERLESQRRWRLESERSRAPGHEYASNKTARHGIAKP